MASAADFRAETGDGTTASQRSGGLVTEVAHVMLHIAAAAAMVALPVLAHTIHPVLGAFAVLILAGTCAALAPQLMIVVILFGFMFQNLVVSLLADMIVSKAEFDMTRAYNFFTVCICWMVLAFQFVTRRFACPPPLARFLKVTVGVLVIIGVYFVIGFALYGTTAIVNLRNIVTPLLLFQICILVFSDRVVLLSPVLTGIGIILLFCGLIEFFFRDDWLWLTNSNAYWNLAVAPNWETLALDKNVKETGIVITGLLDTFRIDFFNSPLLSDLGIVMLRLFGPNFHAISFAYCMAFFLMFTLFRGRLLQATFFAVMLVLGNAKGPVIVLLLACMSWTVFQLLGARIAFVLHCLALAIYTAAGLFVGLRIGDYHALGLMSGIYEFVRNPIGRGIGTGGNLSPLFFTIDFQEAQALGRTPFPVESSVGTLLYQLGVFAFAVIATYVWIGWHLLMLARETRNALQAAAAFALLTLVANGFFQEEAYFAPLALATFLSLAGMMLGAGIRTRLLR